MQHLKENTFKVLNGMSIGIVVALLPSAILGNIFNYLFDVPYLEMLLSFSTSLMALLIGVCIAMQFKLDPISTCVLAVTTMVSGGAVRSMIDGTIQVQGSGDILNAGIGAVLTLLLIHLIGNRLKAYKLIILPCLAIVLVGTITSLTAGPVSTITTFIGTVVDHFTTLQPMLMSILLAISFVLIIISPLSSVAIALLIDLSGIGSAAANVGITGAAITLAILNYRSNGLATALAHFLGSPKIQMANFIKAPIMIVPGLVAGAIASIFVPIFGAVGTPFSAGFGLSGGIGPLGHLGIVGFTPQTIFIAVLVFILIPTLSSFAMVFLFRNVLKWVNDEQYKLDI